MKVHYSNLDRRDIRHLLRAWQGHGLANPTPGHVTRWFRTLADHETLGAFTHHAGVRKLAAGLTCPIRELTVPGGATLLVPTVRWLISDGQTAAQPVVRDLLRKFLEDTHASRKYAMVATMLAGTRQSSVLGIGMATQSVLHEPRPPAGVPAGHPAGLILESSPLDRATTESLMRFRSSRSSRVGTLASTPEDLDLLWQDEQGGSLEKPFAIRLLRQDGSLEAFAVAAYRRDDNSRPLQVLDLCAPVRAERELWDLIVAAYPSCRVFSGPRPLDESRPPDSPGTTIPGLYLRILDPVRAFESRAFGADVNLTLQLSDREFPVNSRAWRLSVTNGAGTVWPALEPPDISLTPQVLAELYLGGASWISKRDDGLLWEHNSGACLRADAAFSGPIPHHGINI